ncbi:MAG: family 1 glycosylhydrolase [Sandaracinaceae bacterium]|nr:family 1 glycosylhydrolase [Sandaracinaceae bacterium]
MKRRPNPRRRALWVIWLCASCPSPAPQPSDAFRGEDASVDGGIDGGEMPDTGRDAYVPDGGPPLPIAFGRPGPLRGDSGRRSFRFGAATAATQIEETNRRTDWWAWTAPRSEGGLGRGHDYVGDAVRGYTKAIEDIRLLREMHLDAYRFSIEWARIEPERNRIDNEAVQHYRRFLEELRSAGIRPMVTVHHFSNPLWADDPRIDPATCTESATQLCGWGHSGPALVQEIAEHAAFLARTYGDLVDEWCTINEPVNYILAAYGVAQFPPGRSWLLSERARFIQVVENFMNAHVAIYRAIRENDTVDADDGDGVPALIGIPLSVAYWIPTRNGMPSNHPDDLAAVERINYLYHFLVPDAALDGRWDPDLDPSTSNIETRESWRGTIDWLGLQYYFRTGVTASPALLPLVRATPCFPPLDSGACLRPEFRDPTHYVPAMRYEFYAPGFYEVVMSFHRRYGPRLPLLATESGIATEVGARRAENIVRILEQIGRLLDEGVDFRGYYHWSLMDNFEWAEGFVPRFGLYRVERSGDYPRTPTLGAMVYGEIVRGRTLTEMHRRMYGGLGPMTPEP